MGSRKVEDVTAKRTPFDRNHAIKLYLSGKSIKQIAIMLGTSAWPVANAVKKAGVSRTLSEARMNHFAKGGVPSVERKDIPVDEIVRRYESGESANALAHAFGASHQAIRERLQVAGVAYRSVAEAAPFRDYREMTARAAKTRTRKIGRGEKQLFKWLTERGERPDPQCPVGPYNIDIAVGRIAVEVETVNVNPFAYPRMRKRIKYLLDRDWWLCFVMVSSNTKLLLPAVADKVVALAEHSRRSPAIAREHWVIRGCGELAASAGDNIDNVALMPPSVDCPHHGGIHKRISR